MDSLNISGAEVYFEKWGIKITSTIVNMWMIIALVFCVCIFLTRNLKTKDISKRQAIAESLVNIATKFTVGNMGEKYKSMAPFVAAIFCLSAFCSLSSLFGFYPATSDLSTILGWSLLIFVMITFTKIKTNKIGGYLKGFTKPIAVLTPFNIISEIATPISMAFRHFGNVASGSVIMGLLNAALTFLSSLILGWVPIDFIANLPIFRAGIPAFASLYFDVFSGVLQAYIFCMLTTMYIANAADKD